MQMMPFGAEGRTSRFQDASDVFQSGFRIASAAMASTTAPSSIPVSSAAPEQAIQGAEVYGPGGPS